MRRNDRMNSSTDIPAQGLPESPELERAVLGALILEPTYLPDVRSLLTGETFADPTNRRIYETILSLDDRGKSVDLASVASALRTSTNKESRVPTPYLVGLSSDVGTGVNCVSWARQLKDTETRRRLVVFSYELAARAASDPDGVLDWATAEISTIGDRATSTNDLRPLGAILRNRSSSSNAGAGPTPPGSPWGPQRACGVSIPIRAAGVAGSWSLWPDVPVWARVPPRCTSWPAPPGRVRRFVSSRWKCAIRSCPTDC